MKLLNQLLEFNKSFVSNKEYESYKTTKKPDKKILLISCMDTRLTELSYKALGLKNGDIKQVKNAGAVISHPYGSTMRSILVAVYMLGVEEVIIMGHTDCGFGALKPGPIIEEMKKRGIREDTLKTIIHSGIDVIDWLEGFDSVEDSVQENVKTVKTHPLMASDIPVHGLVMNPDTGCVEVIHKDY